MRQPCLCVRALYEPVALLLSKTMTCARRRCNATPSEYIRSSHFTVHASHPALHNHTSHLHFTLGTSSHLKSCGLFSPLLTSSQLFSSHPISSHMSSKYIQVSSSQLFSSHPSTDQPFSSPRCSSELISAVLHARKLLLSERRLLHKKTMGAESFCAKKLETQMHLHRKVFPKYFVPQSLHKALPITTLYYKACTKHFQYYFVPRDLHKVLPSTTLYYKACTKNSPVPVLLSTTKLAQSTSQYYFVLQSSHQYYFVLQSLHKALPSTTWYYKACTKHFPVLLCTTKLCTKYFPVLYYFALQTCTKHSPVPLCATKLAQSTSSTTLY